MKTSEIKGKFFYLNDRAMFTRIDNNSFILIPNLKSDKYMFFELNHSATLIIKEIQNGTTFEQLIGKLRKTFTTLSKNDIQETNNFILKLFKLGIVKVKKGKEILCPD